MAGAPSWVVGFFGLIFGVDVEVPAAASRKDCCGLKAAVGFKKPIDGCMPEVGRG